MNLDRDSLHCGSCICLLRDAPAALRLARGSRRCRRDSPIALVGGTVHPVSGPAIEGGVLVFDGGKIVAVGRDVTLPEGAEPIDVAGKHVYPGLIDANSQLGLVGDALGARLARPGRNRARSIPTSRPRWRSIPTAS